MPAYMPESDVEEATIEWLQKLGWTYLPGLAVSPDGPAPERRSYGEVVLEDRLRQAVAAINPNLPSEAVDAAISAVLQAESPNLLEENRRIHRLLVHGVDVSFYSAAEERIVYANCRLVDFQNEEKNDFVAANQFTVVHKKTEARPDVVLFLNGLPIAVIELKKPGIEKEALAGAFNQIASYKADIPDLFRANAVCVLSDGLRARAGSLSADFERFMPWRTVDGDTIAPKGSPELETLLGGIFSPENLLPLLRYGTVFEDDGAGLVKKLAGYHQFHAVQRAVTCTVAASRSGGDCKAGVVWHTQGSGKSLLMAFYAGQLIATPEMKNPTIVVITDRNDLDEQLFQTFARCKDLLRQTPVQAADRDHLRALLKVEAGGVVFTTLQKFQVLEGEDRFPTLTERTNIVVIADEAHRSHYGFEAKIDRKTGEIAYGFAKHLRDALPQATFIGFTGTPIEADDINTPAVFGDYIDVYDIQRAVDDDATVPIYYESRLAKVELDDAAKAEIEELYEEIAEGAGLPEGDEGEQVKARNARIEAIVGADQRIELIARDLVEHFEARTAAMDGKGMVVCMSRAICVKLYDAIVALRPEWHDDDYNRGTIKIVMTGDRTDPIEWHPHIRFSKNAVRDLAKRARDPKDPLKLVLVRDMWLTGFDAPCMHTMYVDKPMKGHGLMQAIARVNRVFKDKPGGLVVDYIGIAESLKDALRHYSPGDRRQTGIDQAEAEALLQKHYEIVKAMFHGFDYNRAISGTAAERLTTLAEGVEWILSMIQRDSAEADTDEDKKRARRRYFDAVLALSKAYALAGASPLAVEIREEVGFFQAVRASIANARNGNGRSKAEIDLAIQQIVSRAVVSTEIVDLLTVAGIDRPDISILSDAFLEEVRAVKHKNVALEALRKLLNEEIRSRLRTNVVQSKAFSERLEEAIKRYHNNALTTVQIIEELIALAKSLREQVEKGEATGLTPEEAAFYDALAQNASAVEILGSEQLLFIAHELLVTIKGSVGIDWERQESARARIRTRVRRILRKYGYPPDLTDQAVRTVLQQAEVLASDWFQ
jgi:type I restriction enzyme R subunit